MLPILQNNSVLTMTSLEISELVNSRHDSVKRTIARLANVDRMITGEPVIQLPPMVDVRNSQGQSVSVYVIGKRDSIIIVAQLFPAFTAVIVDRWQQLEAQQPKHILPQSFAEALQLAANQAAQLEAAKPAIEFVERYTNAEGLKGFREVCKLIGAKENVFRDFLIHKRVMYRLNGSWTAYAEHFDAGRFEVKTGLSDADHSFNQAMFTPKGVAWISQLWSEK